MRVAEHGMSAEGESSDSKPAPRGALNIEQARMHTLHLIHDVDVDSTPEDDFD